MFKWLMFSNDVFTGAYSEATTRHLETLPSLKTYHTLNFNKACYTDNTPADRTVNTVVPLYPQFCFMWV